MCKASSGTAQGFGPRASGRPKPPRRGRDGPGRRAARAAQPPGQAAYLTNQVINALDAPVEAACRELDEADQAAAVPARVPLGTLSPDMARLDAETKQITHAIRMAACNAETALARALDGHYARAGDEAYALIREALTTSGDIRPAPANCSSGSTRSPRRGAPRPWPRSATSSQPPAPAIQAPISSCATRSNPTQPLHKRSPYVRSPCVLKGE